MVVEGEGTAACVEDKSICKWLYLTVL